MLIQLTGKLDPGESYAVVNVNERILPEKSFSLELVSLSFCHNQEHEDTHFPVQEQGTYPVGPAYEEYVTINVPRPRLALHRRRTMYYVPYFEDEDESLQRFVRSASPPLKRVKRNDDIGLMEVHYVAGYNKNACDFKVTDFSNQSPSQIAEKLQTLFFLKIGQVNFDCRS